MTILENRGYTCTCTCVCVCVPLYTYTCMICIFYNTLVQLTWNTRTVETRNRFDAGNQWIYDDYLQQCVLRTVWIFYVLFSYLLHNSYRRQCAHVTHAYLHDIVYHTYTHTHTRTGRPLGSNVRRHARPALGLSPYVYTLCIYVYICVGTFINVYIYVILLSYSRCAAFPVVDRSVLFRFITSADREVAVCSRWNPSKA